MSFSENSIENRNLNKTPEGVLLEKLHLTSGTSIKLTKQFVGTKSNIETGAILEGVLDSDVKMGEAIYLDNRTKNTSNLSGITEKDGAFFIKTATSIYELTFNDSEKIKIITQNDINNELQIFYGKSYKEFDLFNNRVPKKDDPYQLLLINNGFKAGDRILYFDDGKEKCGSVNIKANGELFLLDENGNQFGVFSVLNGKGKYIKKDKSQT